jgi:hypothetical protein
VRSSDVIRSIRRFLVRQVPPLNEIVKSGPCYLVSSKEAGMAGPQPSVQVVLTAPRSLAEMEQNLDT